MQNAADWFRRHHDNAASNVAFREYALSVNLNTGEYKGGDLLFPEYNNHRVLSADRWGHNFLPAGRGGARDVGSSLRIADVHARRGGGGASSCSARKVALMG